MMRTKHVVCISKNQSSMKNLRVISVSSKNVDLQKKKHHVSTYHINHKVSQFVVAAEFGQFFVPHFLPQKSRASRLSSATCSPPAFGPVASAC